jgi:ribosome recycling factor
MPTKIDRHGKGKHMISEDEQKRAQEKIQELTDLHIKKWTRPSRKKTPKS